MMQNPKQRREKKKTKEEEKSREPKKKQKTNENLEQKTKEKNFLAFFTQEVKTQFFTLSQFIIKYTILEEEEEEKSRERDERERETKRGVLLPYHRLSFSVSRRSLCILKEFSWGEIFVVSVYILDNKEK